MAEPEYLENVTFAELVLGCKASLSRTLAKDDIELFAKVSGDVNPAHLDEAYAKTDLFHGIVGHGMWLGALISTVLGTLLPGPGTIYLGQDLKFLKPVRIGDTVEITLTVRDKKDEKKIVTLDCVCINQKGERVGEGMATVMAPTEKIRCRRPELPDVRIQTH